VTDEELLDLITARSRIAIVGPTTRDLARAMQNSSATAHKRLHGLEKAGKLIQTADGWVRPDKPVFEDQTAP